MPSEIRSSATTATDSPRRQRRIRRLAARHDVAAPRSTTAARPIAPRSRPTEAPVARDPERPTRETVVIDARIALEELGPREAGLRAALAGDPPATRRHQHTVSVVIPTLNEARNIGWVLQRLPDVDEVILVDGRSSDSTVAIARAIRPDIRVVLERTPGKGAALRAGFAAATSDLVVMIDADGSMDPDEIEAFIDLLATGHEFVKGSRFLPGGGTTDMTPLRRLGNWGLMAVANLLYGRAYSDLCYGYCAFRRESLATLELDATGFEIETQICVRAAKAGLRTAEVPSFESPRRFGESNLNTFRDGWRVLRTIVRERLPRRAGAGQLVGIPIVIDEE